MLIAPTLPTPRATPNPDHPGLSRQPAEDPAQEVPAPDFVDVSHRQENVDWSKYAAAGHKLAICKATESNSWTDPAVQANREAMKKEGLSCGLYHFAGASLGHTIKPAEEEADWYLSQVGTLDKKEFPVLDFEQKFGLTPAQQVDWIGKWCHRVEEKTGKTPWAYIPTYLLNKMDATSITHYPLWLSNVQSHDPQHPPDSGAWSKITAWQYTEQATAAGMPGHVDGDFLLDPSAVPA